MRATYFDQVMRWCQYALIVRNRGNLGLLDRFGFCRCFTYRPFGNNSVRSARLGIDRPRSAQVSQLPIRRGPLQAVDLPLLHLDDLSLLLQAVMLCAYFLAQQPEFTGDRWVDLRMGGADAERCGDEKHADQLLAGRRTGIVDRHDEFPLGWRRASGRTRE